MKWSSDYRARNIIYYHFLSVKSSSKSTNVFFVVVAVVENQHLNAVEQFFLTSYTVILIYNNLKDDQP